MSKGESGGAERNAGGATPGFDYSESNEGLVWALTQEKDRHEYAGDWAQAETIQAAIYAFKGSKGGGFRKGFGKGSPKGAAVPGKGGAAPAEGSADFNGVCHH